MFEYKVLWFCEVFVILGLGCSFWRWLWVLVLFWVWGVLGFELCGLDGYSRFGVA